MVDSTDSRLGKRFRGAGSVPNGAHRDLRRLQPRLPRRRRLVGLDPDRMRALAGDGLPLGARRSRGLWLLRKPFALLLGLSAAPRLRSRRHPPRGLALLAAGRPEREVALELLPEALRGGEAVICDKGYAGEEFAERVRDLGGFVLRPSRKDEHGIGPWLAPIRQRIESVFWTCKDILCIERHGARTIEGIRERIGSRILALAACISLNHRLGRPSRALVDFVA